MVLTKHRVAWASGGSTVYMDSGSCCPRPVSLSRQGLIAGMHLRALGKCGGKKWAREGSKWEVSRGLISPLPFQSTPPLLLHLHLLFRF